VRQTLGRTSVEALCDLADERFVAGSIIEGSAAAQTHNLVECRHEHVMPRLDGAVFVGLSRAAAAGAHAVVPVQVVVAAGQRLLLGEVVEGVR